MQTLLTRLYQYQKERFPLLVHLPLISAFSFSAIGYSRALRNVSGFIPVTDFIVCVFTNITLFFMLRVADEHKDKEEDARYRSYLPVPRGLVSLREIRYTTYLLFIAATTINLLFYPALLPLYLAILLYLLLMRYEFFVRAWLKQHQVAYILSHMFIIPIVDIYASSFDWKLNGTDASVGLLYFFAVSYLNGLIMELGRKMRVEETEEYGVVSYTKLWGSRAAPAIWLCILLVDTAVAWLALQHAHYGWESFIILIVVAIITALPAVFFINRPARARAKGIEIMSLLWTLAMYLLLGGIPLLLRLVNDNI